MLGGYGSLESKVTRYCMIKALPKANGNQRAWLEGDREPNTESSFLTGQRKDEREPDLLGKSLEKVIAGVAVERKRAGKALRLLTGKLMQAQEEERRRLARELHDGLSQQLA